MDGRRGPDYMGVSSSKLQMVNKQKPKVTCDFSYTRELSPAMKRLFLILLEPNDGDKKDGHTDNEECGGGG